MMIPILTQKLKNKLRKGCTSTSVMVVWAETGLPAFEKLCVCDTRDSQIIIRSKLWLCSHCAVARGYKW